MPASTNSFTNLVKCSRMLNNQRIYVISKVKTTDFCNKLMNLNWNTWKYKRYLAISRVLQLKRELHISIQSKITWKEWRKESRNKITLSNHKPKSWKMPQTRLFLLMELNKKWKWSSSNIWIRNTGKSTPMPISTWVLGSTTHRLYSRICSLKQGIPRGQGNQMLDSGWRQEENRWQMRSRFLLKWTCLKLRCSMSKIRCLAIICLRSTSISLWDLDQEIRWCKVLPLLLTKVLNMGIQTCSSKSNQPSRRACQTRQETVKNLWSRSTDTKASILFISWSPSRSLFIFWISKGNASSRKNSILRCSCQLVLLLCNANPARSLWSVVSWKTLWWRTRSR